MLNALLALTTGQLAIVIVCAVLGVALIAVAIAGLVRSAKQNHQTPAPAPQQEPSTETPLTEEPVAEEPVADEPAVEEPVVEETAVEEPVTAEPVIKEPAVEEPVAEEPVAEEPVTEEPAAEEPVAEEPVAEEPVTEEPAADEPVAEEPVTEEPAAEEPVAEEPVAEEPAVEEPVAEEPVAEEPVAEEPVAEEPVTEEKPAEGQARIVYNECLSQIRASQVLASHFRALRDGIHYDATGGLIQARASDSRTLDGLNPHMGIFDEIHENRDFKLINGKYFATRVITSLASVTVYGDATFDVAASTTWLTASIDT